MAFLSASPCPSSSVRTGVVPLLSGGGKSGPRERQQLLAALHGPLSAPQNHFIFLTRNNAQSKGFQLPFFLFLTAGQGEEEAPVGTFPLPCPQIEAALRACSLPYVMYVHVCVHVCGRFGAWPRPDITHCTTLTRIYNLFGSHFPQQQAAGVGSTPAPSSL